MKKLCLLIAAILLLTALPAWAEGAAEARESQGFAYAALADGTVEITFAKVDDDPMAVPSALDGREVSAIGEFAFSGLGEMTECALPETIRRIGDGAFSDCTALKTLRLPEGNVEIDGNPFVGCGALMEITGCGGRYAVENGAVIDRTEGRLVACLGGSGKSFAVPQSIQTIGASAFAMCENLRHIDIPESVISIGDYAFTYCTALEALELPSGLREIPTEAFSGCTALENIGLPESLTRIGEDAFMGCENLAEVKLPQGLETIGDGAFSSCMSLETVAIPASVTRLGVNPFMDCESLAGIAVGEGANGLLVKDGALLADSGRRLVCYPRALKADSFNVPEGVERIDDYAFYYCNALVSVTIPESVGEIGFAAFEGRENLTLTVARDSYAETYAVENGLKYTYPGADAWLNG